MRVDNLRNYIPYCNNFSKEMPCKNDAVKSNRSLQDSAPEVFSKAACDGLKTLGFGNLIYINNFRENSHPANCNQNPTIEMFPEFSAEEAGRIRKKIDIIEQNASAILERFEELYEDGFDAYEEFSKVYSEGKAVPSIKSSMEIFLEHDDSGELKRSAIFDRGKLQVVRDYKDRKIYVFDLEKNNSSKKTFEVFLNCSDMENTNTIFADESFNFDSGKLYRYSTVCRRDLDIPRFISEETYTFNKNQFYGYDRGLAIVAGAEYSSEFIDFKIKPGVHYRDIEGNLIPRRYIKNKVSAENRILHSSSETRLSSAGIYF